MGADKANAPLSAPLPCPHLLFPCRDFPVWCHCLGDLGWGSRVWGRSQDEHHPRSSAPPKAVLGFYSSVWRDATRARAARRDFPGSIIYMSRDLCVQQCSGAAGCTFPGLRGWWQGDGAGFARLKAAARAKSCCSK